MTRPARPGNSRASTRFYTLQVAPKQSGEPGTHLSSGAHPHVVPRHPRLDPLADRYAARTHGMQASEIRALFSVVSRPEVVSLAGGMPAVTVLSIGARPWENPVSLILPVAALVIAVVPYLTRILRSNMLETLDSDYVELARLKGIPEGRVLRRHALPNTVVPTIQVTALQLAWLVGGVVLIEYLFNYPGIGATLVDSVRNSDFPMVQALTMTIAAAYILVNLVADVLSILLTPRARTGMVA